jgi:hypothetical protein
MTRIELKNHPVWQDLTLNFKLEVVLRAIAYPKPSRNHLKDWAKNPK